MIIEAKILKAISETMTCDKCPYPCRAMAGKANCAARWAEILSEISSDVDWEEIRYKVAGMD